MAKRVAIPMLLVAMLLAASVFVESDEALSECAKQCMPVCLQGIEGSTISDCEKPCESYCKQASSGSDGGGVV